MSEDKKIRVQLPDGGVRDLVPVKVKLPDKTVVTDRVTALFQLHHEQNGEPPHSINARFEDACATSEQTYCRRLKVTSVETKLDLGWITSPGTLVIENRALKADGDRLTREEIAEIKRTKKVRIYSKGEPVWKVSPGRFCIVEPCNAEALTIKSMEGTVDIIIHCIPE